MNEMVKLIFAFWIIVIIVIIVAILATFWWILILIGVIAVIVTTILIVIYTDNKKKAIEENNKMLIGKKHLEENSDKLNILIDKYYQSVHNFVENITDVSHDIFAIVDNIISITPNDTNIIIAPYWQSASLLLKTKFKQDGFEFYNYDTVSHINDKIEKIQRLANFFVEGLKKRIKEHNEWEDEYTLPVALYLIIRNNVIKYHHDIYVKEVKYDNIKDYCRRQNNKQIEDRKTYFTYYYIYKTDINLPFLDTYKEICSKIANEQKKQQEEELENSLFGKIKEPTDSD